MKRWLVALAIVLGTATVIAQVAIPNTFTPGQTIKSSDINTNFTTLGNYALNRLTGGNLSGNITADPGVTIDGIDLSAQLSPTADATFHTVTATNGITVGGNSVVTALGAIVAAALGSGVADGTTYLRGDGTWSTVTTVYQDEVRFFYAGSCPAGFTDLSAAAGGYGVEIMPNGGTLAAKVGTPFTDQEARTHTHSVPSLTASVTGTAAGTGALLPITGNAGSGWLGYYNAPGQIAIYNGSAWGYATTGGGSAPDKGYFGAADHTHSVSASGSTGTGTSGNASATTTPYIQLRACRKN